MAQPPNTFAFQGATAFALRRPNGAPFEVFDRVADALRAHEGPDSLPLLFPDAIARAAKVFVDEFPGRVLYAVKCNPDPAVLRLLYACGVREFDIASRAELQMMQGLVDPSAAHFMHPVKAREAIREAYAAGVRTFVLDGESELNKLGTEIPLGELTLVARLAVSNTAARYALAGKFGATPETAQRLLRRIKASGARVGICFHVGSQCVDPAAYARAIEQAAAVCLAADVAPEILDVGGGFPARYPGMDVPPITDFFTAIDAAHRASCLADAELWCEPGRALVADGGSTLVRVEDRRGLDLYVNDGVFGTLFDAGPSTRWRFPVRRVGRNAGPRVDYRVFGASCDTADVLTHRIALPDDVQEGDWLEFGQLGAYGAALQSRFNGFRPARPVLVREAPLIDREVPHV